MEVALEKLRSTYKYFGYGYLDSPAEAIPPVAMTFYTFRIMVIAGGYLLLFFIVALFAVYYREQWLRNKVVQWIGMLSIVVVWVCSERMDNRRSGPSALGDSGSASHTRRNKRHLVGYRAGDILHVCRRVHDSAHRRNKHHAVVDKQTFQRRH